jgi:hypothetical protein
VKRVVLDESGHHLADVLKALEDANDTSRISHSCIPSVSKYLLAESSSMDYSKVMTGLVVNCVKFNRRMAKLPLTLNRNDFVTLRGISWSVLLKIDNR